jgi:hypothetical protein
MKSSQIAVLLSFSCLLAAPLLAQTTIGGGTCNSASVNGAYAVSLTGRQVNSSGTFTNVFQSNGLATFDGLSKVTFALTADTNQAVATSLTWSGTYTMQANCEGTVSITTGGSATFNLLLYASGVNFNFLLTGSDSTYSYTGNGNNTPTTCSTSLVSGVYTFNAQGFTLSGTSVSGVDNGAGLLQFDGQGHLTVNVTRVTTGATPNALTLTGTYSLSANCVGSATLSDSKANTYVMSLIVSDATTLYSSNLFAALAQNSKFITTGTAHAIYNQPTASAKGLRYWARPPLNSQAKRLTGVAFSGEQA